MLTNYWEVVAHVLAYTVLKITFQPILAPWVNFIFLIFVKHQAG